MIDRNKISTGDLVKVIGEPRLTYSRGHSLAEFIKDNKGSDIGKVVMKDSDGKHLDVEGAVTGHDNWDWYPEDLEPLSENEMMRFRYEWGKL